MARQSKRSPRRPGGKRRSQPDKNQEAKRRHDEQVYVAFQHHRAGRSNLAIRLLEQVLAEDRGHSNASYYLGVVLLDVGLLERARPLLETASRQLPDQAQVFYNLGLVLIGLGRYPQALAATRRSLELNPDSANAHNNHGLILREMGSVEASVESFGRALTIDADHAKARFNLADTLAELGRFEEAKAAYRETLQLIPEDGSVHKALAVLVEHQERDEEMLAMERLYENPGCSTRSRIHLAFGLGKAYEDLGDYDRAFDYLTEGNRLKRQSFQYDVQLDVKVMQKLAEVFQTPVRSSKSIPFRGAAPLFILGMPRSGSTLVEQILASHSQVVGGGELPFISHIVSALREELAEDFPAVLATLSERRLTLIGKDYTKQINKLSTGVCYVTDKMPDNFYWIGLIRAAIPSARFIHTRRDVHDSALSMYKLVFKEGHHYAYDLAELGTYCRAYLQLMDHWRTHYEDCLYEIEYEALVAESERETARLLSWCGLEIEPACFRFFETRRAVRTASKAQVRQPIYRKSVGAWQRYAHRLEVFEAALSGLFM